MHLDASVGLHLDVSDLAAGDLGAVTIELEAQLASDPGPDARLALGLGYYFVARFDEGEALLRQAYLQFKDAGRNRKAALAATHLGRIEHSGFGNTVVASGWFTRARRWLDNDEECAERGWLALGIVGCAVTDADELHRNAELALRLGRELRDADLECRALADYGLALVDRGSYDEGMQRIDEAMTMIRSGECSNLVIIGQVECCFVSACERAGDLARLDGWFSAATRERPSAYAPDARPNMHATHCRTDFGSLLCLAGRWTEADEALRAAVQNSERMHREHYRASRAALADLRLSQGRLHEAAELLRGVETELAASVPMIRLHLARSEYDLAATRCREALNAFTGDLLRGSRFLDLLVLAELGRGCIDDAAHAAGQLAAAAGVTGRAPVRARASLAIARVAMAPGGRRRRSRGVGGRNSGLAARTLGAARRGAQSRTRAVARRPRACGGGRRGAARVGGAEPDRCRTAVRRPAATDPPRRRRPDGRCAPVGHAHPAGTRDSGIDRARAEQSADRGHPGHRS
jgi:tetratricopeptide (TPR) repeat protein